MEAGPTPNFATTPVLVDEDVLAAVELDDPGADDALPEVLVRRADDHLLDRGVLAGHRRRAGQGVVRLELDHRPHRHPQRAQRLLERPGLGPQVRVDALARLVAGPELVAERLDHVVGGHADVGRTVPSSWSTEPTTPRTAATSSPAALRCGGAP